MRRGGQVKILSEKPRRINGFFSGSERTTGPRFSEQIQLDRSN